MADLTACLCYRGAEEAAAALNEPRFPGAKNAEIKEEKSHHTTPRHLCGGGPTGDRPGKYCSTSGKHRSAKLSRELTSGPTSQSASTLMAFICCTCCLEEGAGAVLEWIGNVLVLRESGSPSDVDPTASVFTTAVSMGQCLMLSSSSVRCLSELSGSRGNL